MSYLQEAQLPTARVERVERQPSVLPARVALPLLMLLAFFHGALYAVFLPPWGLIDEAQHLHYIQYIAEQQALPVAGEVYLSDEIVASLFATRRWETFHWAPPAAADPQMMGLEGHSYEAYQPPLFYLLMAPIYLVLPDHMPDAMLVKVYALRGVVVLLSLVTVWAIYRTAQTLLPHHPTFPFWAGLLLVSIPERAMATSRINNDALLEVVAALFVLALTRCLVVGLTMRRSVLLGLLLGLAVWSKISAGVLGVPLLMLFWLRRRDAMMPRHFGWMAGAAAPFAIGLALRNLWLYGDLTGFGSFDQLHRLAPTELSLVGILQSLISVLNHFWLVWWKGADAGQNGVLTLFYTLMFVVVIVAWARLGLYFWQQWQSRDRHTLYAGGVEAPVAATLAAGDARTSRDDARVRANVAWVYAATVLICALAVVGSYYEGMVPVIQGRFMLPAVLPFVLLLVWGLWLTRYGAPILLAVVIVLWGMGLLSLFGNLIPYYYYWSGVLAGTMPHFSDVGMGELLALVYGRVTFDKPAFLSPLLLILPVCYATMLLATLFMARRSIPIPARQPSMYSASQPARPLDS